MQNCPAAESPSQRTGSYAQIRERPIASRVQWVHDGAMSGYRATLPDTGTVLPIMGGETAGS